MYIGYCTKKDWIWKKVKSNLIPEIETDSAKTLRCYVFTNKTNGFNEDNIYAANQIDGFLEGEIGSNIIQFKIDNCVDLEVVNDLQTSIQEALPMADKAIISIRRNTNQYLNFRCGKR